VLLGIGFTFGGIIEVEKMGALLLEDIGPVAGGETADQATGERTDRTST
jgi:hypothetical protein